MKGVHMDPQTVKLPGADPLTADALVKFRAQTAGYLADLASPRGVRRWSRNSRPDGCTADLGGDQQGSPSRSASGLLGRGHGPIRG